MKNRIMNTFFRVTLATCAAFLAIAPSATAALTFNSGYGGINYYTDSTVDIITSYDWGSDGSLYYATANSGYVSTGVYRHDGVEKSTVLAGSNSLFAGGSVVSIGSSIYFNDSTLSNVQRIHQYAVGSGNLTTTIATNYSLGTDGTDLYTSGGDFSETSLTVYSNGLSGATIDLGGVDGASGPLTFDSSGHLYYAPGFGDLSIYRWTPEEVADAIAGNVQLSADNHRWADYGSAFPTAGGATSMLADSFGNLFVTITSFSDPSSLVKFSAGGNGVHETLATSFDRLGELRMHEGNLYVSEADNIVQIIPEPSSFLLSVIACGMSVIIRRR